MPAAQRSSNRQSRRFKTQAAVAYNNTSTLSDPTPPRPLTDVLPDVVQHPSTTPPISSARDDASLISNVDTDDTFGPCVRKKKGNILRQRNPFMFFRSHYYRLRKAGELEPDSQDQGQRQISRAAGEVWSSMSPKARAPFENLAREEKEIYRRDVPDYSYRTNRKAGKPKRGRSKAILGTCQFAIQPQVGNADDGGPAVVNTPNSSPAPLSIDDSNPAVSGDGNGDSNVVPSSAEPCLSSPKPCVRDKTEILALDLLPPAYNLPGEQFGIKPQVYDACILWNNGNGTETALGAARDAVSNPFVPVLLLDAAESTGTAAAAVTAFDPAHVSAVSNSSASPPATQAPFHCPWDPTTEPKTWGVYEYAYLIHQRRGPRSTTSVREARFDYKDVETSVFLPPAQPLSYHAEGLEKSFADMAMGSGNEHAHASVGLTARERRERERKVHELLWERMPVSLGRRSSASL